MRFFQKLKDQISIHISRLKCFILYDQWSVPVSRHVDAQIDHKRVTLAELSSDPHRCGIFQLLLGT